MIKAAQELCVWRPAQDSSYRDIRALSSITMELMQGYVKENGAIGVDNPNRWSDNALDFLSQTTSATSAAALAKASWYS
jgi:hypothetical protein